MSLPGKEILLLDPGGRRECSDDIRAKAIDDALQCHTGKCNQTALRTERNAEAQTFFHKRRIPAYPIRPVTVITTSPGVVTTAPVCGSRV